MVENILYFVEYIFACRAFIQKISFTKVNNINKNNNKNTETMKSKQSNTL